VDARRGDPDGGLQTKNEVEVFLRRLEKAGG
jgi:hypothetical protein